MNCVYVKESLIHLQFREGCPEKGRFELGSEGCTEVN